jgi:hypothetical protein
MPGSGVPSVLLIVVKPRCTIWENEGYTRYALGILRVMKAYTAFKMFSNYYDGRLKDLGEGYEFATWFGIIMTMNQPAYSIWCWWSIVAKTIHLFLYKHSFSSVILHYSSTIPYYVTISRIFHKIKFLCRAEKILNEYYFLGIIKYTTILECLSTRSFTFPKSEEIR